jgi:lipopolysaccharide/colanic/teichoic acid biosynthesis glycosyltransferase
VIRFFDVLFSLIGLVLLFPVFVVLSLFINLTSKGGVFYLQQRIGRNSEPFMLYKFRSMYVSSDKAGLLTVGKKDPRITPIGYFIRKYKLDELPQLFNVIKGEMSLVGPRPEVEKYTRLYTNEQKKVLSVVPGITDYASIHFSNENELLDAVSNPEEYYINEIMPEKLKLNLIYINHYNLKNYFTIIFKTLLKILD